MLCWRILQRWNGWRSHRQRSRRTWTGLVLGLVAWSLLSVQAPAATAAEPRIALVIGNGNYRIGPLRNPTNDARLIAATLKSLGFEVMLETDIDQKEMKRAIRAFGEELRDAGPSATGLFYYAGHGVQVDGINYLLPLGAEIEAEADVEIEAVSADTILAQMQFAENKVNLVFLDACRNNPLTRSFTRSANRGLARVDAPRGSFVGYSTAPGDVSVDGDAGNSPYSLALAEELRRPGASIEEVHRAVRLRVLSATGNKQTPWDSSSLTASVVLAPEMAAPVAAAIAAPAPAETAADGAYDVQADVMFWEEVRNSNAPGLLENYLREFPNGKFRSVALQKLATLRGGAAPAAASGPAPAATAPAATAPAITAPEAAPAIAAAVRHIALKNANIRARPDKGAKVIGKLQSGESISVIGRDGDWLQVAGAAGEGYVSAALLDPAPLPPPVAAPAPVAAAPAPTRNELLLSAALRDEVERFVANSAEIKGNYRFLAVNGAGNRIGTSTTCKIKKTGWGGFSASGCNEETARDDAIRACGDGDCRIIYNGTRKEFDFEIAWSDGAPAAATAETQPEPAAVETSAATEPAAPAYETAAAPGSGGVLRLSSALKDDIAQFLANSAQFKGNYRFLAVNGAGDKIGTSTTCKIKKTGWGGFSASGCNEETSRDDAIRACGPDCRIIYEGTRKVGDFEIAWQ
jgi:hypothetical protein